MVLLQDITRKKKKQHQQKTRDQDALYHSHYILKNGSCNRITICWNAASHTHIVHPNPIILTGLNWTSFFLTSLFDEKEAILVL